MSIKSYYEKDTFLWQDLTGELAHRYVQVLRHAMRLMGYCENSPVNGLAVDVGCGGGRYTQLLPAYFSDVCGVDYTHHFCEAGNEAFGDKMDFVCGDATCLPIKDHTADFVLSIGLTECLTQRQLINFLSEVKRVLKPGGRLLVRYCRVGGSTHLLSKIGRGVATAYPEFYCYSGMSIKNACYLLGFHDIKSIGGLLLSRWYGIERLGRSARMVQIMALWQEKRFRRASFLYDTAFLIAQT